MVQQKVPFYQIIIKTTTTAIVFSNILTKCTNNVTTVTEVRSASFRLVLHVQHSFATLQF